LSIEPGKSMRSSSVHRYTIDAVTRNSLSQINGSVFICLTVTMTLRLRLAFALG